MFQTNNQSSTGTIWMIADRTGSTSGPHYIALYSKQINSIKLNQPNLPSISISYNH